MNRPLIIGVVGGTIAVVAISLAFLVDRPPAPSVDTARTPESTPAGQEPAAGPSGESRAALPAPAVVEPPVRPSFDVVRINPQGDAVIAGRAAPGAEVTIREGNKDIGKVRADSRGEWVLIPDKPLPAGSRELSVVAKTPAGARVESKRNLLVVVPEPGKDIAGRPSKRPSGTLAMLVPRDGGGGTTVLQKPSSPVSGVAATPTARRPSSVAAMETPSPAPTSAAAEQPAAAQLPSPAPTSAAAEQAVAAQLPSPAPTSAAAERPAAVQPPSTAPKTAAAEQPPAAGSFALSIDAVDYDDTGKVSLSGRAPPKSRVQVYLGKKLIGVGTAAEKGAWRVTPEKKVAVGLYDLRVDQVDESGRVIARVKTKFLRAKPLVALPGDVVVFVQPGNSLWRIARRKYGSGIQYTVIYEANRGQIGDPSLIYPGQVFVLPQVN